MSVNSFENYPMNWKPDKSLLKRPLYISLADRLEQDIKSGSIAPGTKLPPQRELADYLDINFTTVTRAYSLCEMRGLIYAEKGRGTFVSQKADTSITISQNISGDDIDLAFIASFEQTNDMICDAVRKASRRPYLSDLLDYSDPSGMPHHKDAACSWLSRLGSSADPDDITIVSGGMNALAVALLSMFDPGDRIAVEIYTFSNFIELASMMHIHLMSVEGDSEGMIADALESQCRQFNIKGVFLMPSCSNPTTVYMTEKRKAEIAVIIEKYGLYLIEDDSHAFMTPDIVPDYIGPLSRHVPDQSLYICSISKSLCSGLRVAYLVSRKLLTDRIRRAVYNINVKTPSLNAEIVTELIGSGRADDIVRKKKDLAEKAQQIFNRHFPDAPACGHPLSYFRWLPLPAGCSGKKAEQDLKEKGILVYHSGRFQTGSSSQREYLRISLATTPTLRRLDLGLSVVEEYLHSI